MLIDGWKGWGGGELVITTLRFDSVMNFHIYISPSSGGLPLSSSSLDDPDNFGAHLNTLGGSKVQTKHVPSPYTFLTLLQGPDVYRPRIDPVSSTSTSVTVGPQDVKLHESKSTSRPRPSQSVEYRSSIFRPWIFGGTHWARLYLSPGVCWARVVAVG